MTDEAYCGTFNIYFQDLNPKIQEQLLKFHGIKEPSKLNLNDVPLAVLEKPTDMEECPNCGAFLEKEDLVEVMNSTETYVEYKECPHCAAAQSVHL